MGKRIWQAWCNAGLWRKLLLLMLLAVTLILGCSQPILYFYVSDVVYQQAKQEAHMTLVQAQTYLDTKINHVLERLFYIQLDPGFSDTLKDYFGEDGTAAWGSAMSVISPVLSLHKVTEPLVSSLYLHTPKEAFTDGGLSVNRSYALEDSSLYGLLGDADSHVAWGTVQTDEMFITQRKVIPVLYRFRVDGYPAPCVLVANIDVRALINYLQNIVPGPNIHLLLLDNQGTEINLTQNPLYAQLRQQPALLQSLLDTDNVMQEGIIFEEPYLLSHTALRGAPWHIVYAQSEQMILDNLHKLRLVFFVVFAVVLLLLTIVVRRIVRSVTKPLLQLSETMRRVEQKGEMQPFVYPYGNEIGVLSSRFNAMMERIQVLLAQQTEMIRNLQEEKEKVKVEQQLKRRAELKALQAQINPHFLYNTLDSIRWKAEAMGAQDISEMTKALATLFRVGLSRGREIIPLGEEMRHVNSYLQIQKQRYGNRLRYNVDIPENLEQCYVVKLILQPLVENAIYHGIKERESPGTIQIRGAMEDGELVLRVEDDGPGIPETRLQMLQKDLARSLSVSGEGYGIFNVNERVRLYFGAPYGLLLDSRQGVGCCATIRLPCVYQKEVEQYVSLADRG